MRFLVSLCFAFVLVSCGDAERRTSADVLVGQKFPELEIQDMNGEGVTLSQFIDQDKPLVLNVWATWCPPCVKELPSLYELAMTGEFDVLTIAVDGQKEKVETFLKRNEFTYLSVFWDKLGEQTREKLKSVQLPMTYLVREGQIKAVYAGERTWHHPKMIEKLRADLER